MDVVSDTSSNRITLTIGMTSPPGEGYVLQLPAEPTIKSMEIDGVSASVAGKNTVDLKAGTKVVVMKY